MKRFSLMTVSFIFTAVFAMSAFGQVPAATTTGKIGLVNINMFADEKTGITKFKTALTVFNNEFKPSVDELNTMETRRVALAKEIQTLQQQRAAGGAVPVSTSTLETKVEEYQTLETNMKRKQEDLKARQESRYPAVVGPVFGDIVKAMK